MDSLFRLLEERNSRLKELYKINALEMKRLSQGRTGNLKKFCFVREQLLQAIARADEKIASAPPPSKPSRLSRQDKNKIKNLLLLKRAVILSILDQDIAIISLVEDISSRSYTPALRRKRFKKAA